MSENKLRAAILIVSDTAARDDSADKSRAILSEVLDQESAQQWEIADTKIVGDETVDVQRVILSWTDGPHPMNLIVTSGGTGFSVKDQTPEVGAVDVSSSG